MVILGFWSRGYHGDCRDCIHYKHCYHYIDKDEWHCSYSGEDFKDEYGDQCHFFYDIEQQRLEQEREAHKYDFIAGMAFFSQYQDDDEEEQDEQDKREVPYKTESNDGSENILYVILIWLLILYAIYFFSPLVFSLIFYTVLILIFSLYSSIFSGNIKTKLFKSFLISIIINIIIEVF